MPTDQTIPLTDGPATFEGAVSLEISSAGVKPWRLPFSEVNLFEPPLIARAGQPSGIRLTFLSDTPDVSLEIEPVDADAEWIWDLLIDGQLHERVKQSVRKEHLSFTHLPAQKGVLKRVEIFLPTHYYPVRVRRLSIAADALINRWADPRKRWVVYGSSITQAKEAAGPSETWPAVVAKRFDLHLTALGYGGEEHMEPMVARMIRDLPADYIGLCVGGNIWGVASLSKRTYRAGVIGLVKTIRDNHPATPMAVTSFITVTDEGANNILCLSLDEYRRWTADATAALQAQGDRNLHFIDGPAIYGRDLTCHMPDGVHPDEEGQRILGKRYGDIVMPKLGLGVPR